MDHNHEFSFGSRLKSFSYAFNGLKKLLQTEHNARIHVVAAALAVSLAFLFRINEYEWCFLIAAIGFVFTAEIINTAIECLTDMVSPEYSKQAEKVKDLAAGGVLVASLTALVTGLIIFINNI